MAAEYPKPIDEFLCIELVFCILLSPCFVVLWVLFIPFGSYRVRKIFSGYVKNFPLYVFIERADLTHTLMHQAFDRDDAMHSVTHDVSMHTQCVTHGMGCQCATERTLSVVLRNIMWCSSWHIECVICIMWWLSAQRKQCDWVSFQCLRMLKNPKNGLTSKKQWKNTKTSIYSEVGPVVPCVLHSKCPRFSKPSGCLGQTFWGFKVI